MVLYKKGIQNGENNTVASLQWFWVNFNPDILKYMCLCPQNPWLLSEQQHTDVDQAPHLRCYVEGTYHRGAKISGNNITKPGFENQLHHLYLQ